MNSFDFILSSQLLDQLAEYSVPNQTISHGVLIGTITLSTRYPEKRSMTLQSRI